MLEILAERLVLLRHVADLSQLVLEITQQLLLLPELYLLLVDAEQLGEDGVSSARGSSTHLTPGADLVPIQGVAGPVDIPVIGHLVSCLQIPTQKGLTKQ